MNTGVASLWTASNLVWVQTAAESVLFPKSESAAAARHSPRGRGVGGLSAYLLTLQWRNLPLFPAVPHFLQKTLWPPKLTGVSASSAAFVIWFAL